MKKMSLFFIMCCFLSACSSNETGFSINRVTDSTGIVGGEEISSQGDAHSNSVAMIYGEKEDGNGYICTGAFLTNEVILTAAHCIIEDPKKMFVFTGTRPLEGEPSHQVTATKVHESYHAGKTEERNDIALIFLKESLPEVVTVGLWNDSEKLTKLSAYGYGRIEGKEDSETASNEIGILRKVELQPNLLEANEKGLYTYDQSQGKGVCFGDSGGPLFAQDGSVIGVASGVVGAEGDSDSCQYKSYFTKVSLYLDWIEKNLKTKSQP